MRLLAPAKINLHLRVGPAQPSGFHPLVSWMVTVALFDTLTIRETAPRGDVRLSCDVPRVPTDSTNLVVRAIQAMDSSRGVDVMLQKRIPTGGGLGGGSSDAARVLLGVNRLWKLDRSIDELARIGAALGSDVPFFLHGPSSVCLGRGELVQPIAPPAARWAVLFVPEIALATRDVYRMFDQLRLGDQGFGGRQPDWREWTGLSARPLLPRLVNDLEPAAFALCPELRALRGLLEAALVRVIRVSGSGSTLFTLFDAQEEAERAAHVARDKCGVTSHVAELAPRIVDDLS